MPRRTSRSGGNYGQTVGDTCHHLPRNISLDDGTPVTLRPLLKTDEAALVEYFSSLPPEDRLCLQGGRDEPQGYRELDL